MREKLESLIGQKIKFAEITSDRKLIIETDRGNLDIRFLCNDGGYSFGGGELFIILKTK